MKDPDGTFRFMASLLIFAVLVPMAGYRLDEKRYGDALVFTIFALIVGIYMVVSSMELR